MVANDEIVKYILILAIVIFIFNIIPVGTNIIIAIVVFALIIYISYYHNNEIQIDKTETIRPKPYTDIIYKYPDVVNCIFQIQHLYKYNVPAFENFIDITEQILLLYEQSLHSDVFLGMNYNMIEKHKKNAMNELHSLIYELVDEYDELYNQIVIFESIINKFLEEIKIKLNAYIFRNGFNRNVTIIDNSNIKSNNYYDYDIETGKQLPFSFDVF